MHRVDPSRLDLAREFKRHPTGPHSPELQRLLKLLRWEPIDSRFVVVQPERDGPWYLAHTTGPKGHALEMFWEHAYETLGDAHWALFRARWQQHTGQPLQLDERDRESPLPGSGTLTRQAARKPLLGYADSFSVENGHSIQFKVSSEYPGQYRAEIVRLRCADHTGVGLKQTTLPSTVNGLYPARFQPTYAGSYIDIGVSAAFVLTSGTLQAYLWPTTPLKGRQAIMGNWDETTGHGYALMLDEQGALALLLGDGQHRQVVSTRVPLLAHHWYVTAASFVAP